MKNILTGNIRKGKKMGQIKLIKLTPITEKEIEAVKTLLKFMGEDPEREGLKDTPKRFLKAWRDCWASGYRKDKSSVMKVFNDGGENYDEMVLVKNIEVFSHCEHHLAPIIGKAHVAYIPSKGRIVGLSKINRLVDMFSRRLQVQERLTSQIAETLWEELKPLGVGVYIEADHFCVKTRGIQDTHSITSTSKFLGVFFKKVEVRNEFLSLVKNT